MTRHAAAHRFETTSRGSARATAAIAAVALCAAGAALAGEPIARPVHTYSIVARDAGTGQIGVAVQSHWFSVGPIVPWAEAGVGAVATQSLVDVSYGPRGLALMRDGLSAPEALRTLLREDPQREVRQVAMLDASGRVAVHTGKLCIAGAGHESGEQFSTQANLMENETVWGAMADAYRRASGPLAGRLLAALDAAEAAGGDVRGQQSAAILVVDGTKSERPWEHRVVELRVEDHPAPLAELRRLAHLHAAYELANEGDEMVALGRFDEAMRAYDGASRRVPENVELRYWQAASLYKQGHRDQALEIFRDVFQKGPKWALVTARLEGLDILAPAGPRYEQAVREILSVAPDEARTSGLAEWGKRRRTR